MGWSTALSWRSFADIQPLRCQSIRYVAIPVAIPAKRSLRVALRTERQSVHCASRQLLRPEKESPVDAGSSPGRRDDEVWCISSSRRLSTTKWFPTKRHDSLRISSTRLSPSPWLSLPSSYASLTFSTRLEKVNTSSSCCRAHIAPSSSTSSRSSCQNTTTSP